MKMEIYYFYGTGNSLAVARDIAAKTKGILISIPSVIDRPSIKTDADIIGVVFPSYMAHLYGIPLMVERFIRKVEGIRAKYIFAVCTCGGYESVNALPTLKNLARLIKSLGGNLSAEFSIRLPMNNLDYDHLPVPIDSDQETMFKNCQSKVGVICRCVMSRKRDKYRIIKWLFNAMMAPLYRVIQKAYIEDLKQKAMEPVDTELKYYELMPLTDMSIRVNDKCSGCGTCARVCPARNIQMVENRPVWLHRCEICFACDEWCPQKAIHHWGKTEGQDYHHPSVKVSDMFM